MQIQKEERYIQNPFQTLWNAIDINKVKIAKLFIERLLDFTKFIPVPFLKSRCTLPAESCDQHSIFEGSGGYLYLYIKLFRFFTNLSENDKNILHQASILKDEEFFKLIDPSTYLKKSLTQYENLQNYLQNVKQSKKSLSISFCFSKTATYLCGVHLGFLTNNKLMFQSNIDKILQYSELILQKKKTFNIYYQLLYGVAGYLYNLLEIQKYYQFSDNVSENFRVNLTKNVSDLLEIIIDSGFDAYVASSKKNINLKDKLPNDFRLVYLFYDKQYLGGAHGLAGVLNIIFLALQLNKIDEILKQKIRILTTGSVEFLLRQEINGNFPTRAGSKSIKLVQFCHGAPGVISCLLRFCKLYPAQANQLKLKQKIPIYYDHIWKYGIIKKGFYGLCHGISGNSYPFINSLIKEVIPDKSQQYKKKASLMWLLQLDQKVMKAIRQFKFQDRHYSGISDYPYSLMLGTAGDIIFATDLIKGQGPFPGFDL